MSMYPHPGRLDTPPPTSQFRHPWSPEPYEPVPQTLNAPQEDAYYDLDNEHRYSRYPQPQQQRREPSDVSVEALDLADYAHQLRTAARTTDPYPAHYPPSSPPSHVPSLVSRGETLTSTTYSTSSRNIQRTPRRPFSLPPGPPSSSHTARGNRTATPHAFPTPTPEIADPEIDISQLSERALKRSLTLPTQINFQNPALLAQALTSTAHSA